MNLETTYIKRGIIVSNDKAVLSQSEIDSLLQAMNDGEVDEESLRELDTQVVKAFDFRRPVRLSKEYISTISMILEDFAKNSVNQLSSKLRKQIDMELVSIDQVTFDEFVNSVPKFTLLGTLLSAPQNGIQLLEINPQLSMQMVEILLGYDEISSLESLESEKDDFTDIEVAVLEEVVESFAFAFESAWRDTLTIQTTLESIDTKPQLIQTISPNESVVLATFNFSIDGQTSFVNLCIPYLFFEDILDKLSFSNWFHTGKDNIDSDEHQFEDGLQTVPVTLKVLLGQIDMTIEDFVELETGDIVNMNKKTSSPLSMLVEDKPYFKVKPGNIGDKLGVEVLQFTNERNQQ